MDSLAGDERFAVLSIDGGGVRGIFAAAVLANLERDTGTRITDHFDLIVGTSTGGIIALGLGAGMSPEEILALLRRQRGLDLPGAAAQHPGPAAVACARQVQAGWPAGRRPRDLRGQAAVRQRRPARDPVLQHRRERGVPVQDPAPRAPAA